jgi:VanZ family protein
MRLLVWVYTALLVYGSLFPFSGWAFPHTPLFSFLSIWPATLERSDIILNVLVYAPLGLFIVSCLIGTMRFAPALLLASLAGTSLSFIIENIQQFLPRRVESTSDLVMNMAGTILGGMIATFFSRETVSGAKLVAHRRLWFRTGTLPNIGLITLGLWALTQTTPLVPALDMSHLRHGLAVFYYALQEPELGIYETSIYALYITGLGLLAATIGQRGKPVILLFGVFIACVLISKMLIETRQLSLEALAGATVAFAVLLPFRRIAHNTVVLNIVGAAFIAAGFILYESVPVPGFPRYTYTWTPFSAQMVSLNGLQSILEIFWPLFALAYFTRSITLPHLWYKGAIFGGVMVCSTVFVLEWLQQYVPGRHGDITQVMLGILGWFIPWLINWKDHAQEPAAPAAARKVHAGGLKSVNKRL